MNKRERQKKTEKFQIKRKEYLFSLMNFFMKRGLKNKATNVYLYILAQIKKKMDQDPNQVICEILKKYKILVDFKKIKKGGKLYTVPFPVYNLSRREKKLLRLIILNARKRYERTFHEKLAIEFLDFLDNKSRTNISLNEMTKLVQENSPYLEYIRRFLK
jgi:ribosomal protein S7